MITFERAVDVAAPPARVWEVMSDGELALDGWFAGWMARLSGAITERYLAYEAEGLKARSEDPTCHRAR